MSLIVEDGTNVTGANSYVTVAEVTAYWAARNDTVWAAAASNGVAQEAACIIATQFIDKTYRWKGYRKYAYQYLNFPRFVSLVGAHHMLDPALLLPGILTIPVVLKDAVCQLALEALNGNLMPSFDRSARVSSESVGKIAVSYFADAPTTPKYPMIDMILAPLCNGKAFGGLTTEASRG